MVSMVEIHYVLKRENLEEISSINWFSHEIFVILQQSKNNCFTCSVTNMVRISRRGAFHLINVYSFHLILSIFWAKIKSV